MPRLNALSNIPKVRFHEPELNLPGRRLGLDNEESWFTIQFAKDYIKQHLVIHQRSKKNNIACIRQIAINGFGIADMVAVSWESNINRNNKKLISVEEFLLKFKPTIRAFEIKLNNWRKGMIQAHRYRYFANATILVLPMDRNSNALKHIETFKKIHVGLWSYDPSSKRILVHYTPRPSSVVEMKHMIKAVHVMANTSKVLPILRKH